MKEAQLRLYASGYVNPMKGKTSDRKGKKLEEIFGSFRAADIKKRISEAESGKEVSEETRVKIRKFMKGRYAGPNNHNWNGGTSFLPYPPNFNGELKEFIRQRDNFVCQLCNETQEENGRKLAVHHIDYDKNNCSIENLITLCIRCNNKVNGNRVYWKEFFSSIIGEMKNE